MTEETHKCETEGCTKQIEGTFKHCYKCNMKRKEDKQEAQSEEKSVPTPQETPQKPIESKNTDDERTKLIKLQVCFKAAVEITKTAYTNNPGIADMEEMARFIETNTIKLYQGLEKSRLKLKDIGDW